MGWKTNISDYHWTGIVEWYEDSKGNVLIITNPSWEYPIKMCLREYFNITVISTSYDRKNLEWIKEFKNR